MMAMHQKPSPTPVEEADLRRALELSQADVANGRVQPIETVLTDMHRRVAARIARRQRQLPAAE